MTQKRVPEAPLRYDDATYTLVVEGSEEILTKAIRREDISYSMNYVQDPRNIESNGQDLLAGDRDGNVVQFSHETPWRLADMSYSERADLAGTLSDGDLFSFTTDGETFIVAGNNQLWQFSMDTWSASTLAYDNKTVETDETDGFMSIESNGETVILSDRTAVIHEYNLSDPWDIDTLSYVQSVDLSQFTEDANRLLTDGRTLLVWGDDIYSDEAIMQWNFSKPWDISTLSYFGFKLTEQTVPETVSGMVSSGGELITSGARNTKLYSYTYGRQIGLPNG